MGLFRTNTLLLGVRSRFSIGMGKIDISANRIVIFLADIFPYRYPKGVFRSFSRPMKSIFFLGLQEWTKESKMPS